MTEATHNKTERHSALAGAFTQAKESLMSKLSRSATAKRRAGALKAWAQRRRYDRMYAYRNNLSFMNRKARGSRWWNVSPTGDYQADYETGRQHAMEFWRQCGAMGTFGLDLSSILLAIQDLRKKRSGIEVGFIRTIGEIVGCLCGMPAFITSLPKRLPKNFEKIKIQKRVYKYKARQTVALIDLLLRSAHDRDRKAAASLH
jgi:hypothetical protein